MNNSEMPGKVRRIDEELRLADWPQSERIGNISVGRGECLVAAMGFEERAVAALRRACNGSKGFHVGLVRYLPMVEQNRESEFLGLSEANGLHVEEFDYDRTRPAGMGIALAKYAARFEKVYVDISGMSRLLIVQILAALMEDREECVVLYSEANVYPPRREDYEASRRDDTPSPSFISSGILEVVSTPELSAVAMLGSAIRLVVFLSFDPSQLSNLIQEIQPTHINVVHGKPPHAQLGWRTKAVVQMNEKTVEMQRNVEESEACTFDYRETLEMILEVYDRHATFNRIVLAPTGSKMQAVAIGIVRGILGDVQVVYPTPRRFLHPGRYTEGVKEVFEIPLRWGGLR